MKESVLDWPERELLGILISLHSWRGPVSQDTLAVAARGRGLAVSRPLARLKAMGLIEAVKKRPPVFLRLFGYKAEYLIAPSEQALSQDWWHGEKAQRILSVVPQVAQTIDKPDTKPKLFSAPPPILLQQNVPPQSMPNSTQVKTPTVSLIELPAATSSDDNTTIALSVAHPVRPVSAAFTEDLGGVPLTESAANEACMVDANVLAGIREMLASLGIELTAAGEVLIADRVESGASPGDALVQVVLYAFGHAARHGMLETRTFLGLSLSDFAVFAVQELEKLRAADVICEARFDEDMRNLWSTITNPSESLGELLADPIGGAAPPALLPEDMRSSDD